MWLDFQAHPSARPYASHEDLSEASYLWVLMQAKIDRGESWCRPCDRFGAGTFCGACGRRFYGADLRWRRCRCGASVPTDWCSACGVLVVSARRKSFEAGTLDLGEASARAASIMRKFFGDHAVTAPAWGPTSLRDAVLEEFGGHER